MKNKKRTLMAVVEVMVLVGMLFTLAIASCSTNKRWSTEEEPVLATVTDKGQSPSNTYTITRKVSDRNYHSTSVEMEGGYFLKVEYDGLSLEINDKELYNTLEIGDEIKAYVQYSVLDGNRVEEIEPELVLH